MNLQEALEHEMVMTDDDHSARNIGNIKGNIAAVERRLQDDLEEYQGRCEDATRDGDSEEAWSYYRGRIDEMRKIARMFNLGVGV